MTKAELLLSREDAQRRALKWLFLVATAWDLAIVAFAGPFAPPLEDAQKMLGLQDYLMRRFFAFESLFFHSLAVPFTAALVFATLLLFRLPRRTERAVIVTSTAGFMLASIAMLYIVLVTEDVWIYTMMVLGLGLCVASGLIMAIAYFPRSEEGSPMRLRGRSLVTLALWVSIVATLASVALGVFASTGSTEWGAVASFEKFRLMVASHEHTVITVIDAAIIVLVVKHYKADGYKGVPGAFVKWGLYGMIVGVPTVTVSTFGTVPIGVEAHNAITIFATILLQAALFIMYAIMAVEWRRLRIGGMRGLAKNIMSYGMLFVIFWVNVVVTLPGIYVAVNLKRFVGLPNEVAFVTGHEHILITLTAIALLMLMAVAYDVKGRLGALAGAALTSGYIVSTAATVLYMFYDWDPLGSAYVPYIDAGIVTTLVGVFLSLIGIARSKGVKAIELPLGMWSEA